MEGNKSPEPEFKRRIKVVPAGAEPIKQISLTKALSDTWMWVYLNYIQPNVEK